MAPRDRTPLRLAEKGGSGRSASADALGPTPLLRSGALRHPTRGYACATFFGPGGACGASPILDAVRSRGAMPGWTPARASQRAARAAESVSRSSPSEHRRSAAFVDRSSEQCALLRSTTKKDCKMRRSHTARWVTKWDPTRGSRRRRCILPPSAAASGARRIRSRERFTQVLHEGPTWRAAIRTEFATRAACGAGS